MATARVIKVSPRWEIITEAELINEKSTEVERRLNIIDAINDAIEINLDLAAKKLDVSARNQDYNKALSNLLPQIELFASGILIDDDRAKASLGSRAEKTLSGTAQFTQLIFSEPVFASLSIEKKLKMAREYQLEQFRLDIARDAAVAYLNLLVAKTIERIQKNNLKLTRSNLELAKIRRSVGTSGPGEVYRWESQLASNRKSVVEAQAARNAAEIDLNRILHRPIEESFLTDEVSINDFLTEATDSMISQYTDNKADFRLFRDYMVNEALNYSPEIKQLEYALAAQKRLATSKASAFWAPTLALQGSISKKFDEGGAGSESTIEFPPELGIEFPQADNVNWNIGLNLSFPIFRGGSKFAERKQAVENAASLRLELESLKAKVEQHMRSALHFAGASSAGIGFSRDASEAARKNLELVTNAYSRGVADAIDLLDAQNASLVADQVYANAVYQFMIDIVQIQRAAGRFYFLESTEKRLEELNKLKGYFEKFDKTK
jgi:outer membrane protein TolC